MESSLDSVCCISDCICLRRDYDRTKEVYKKNSFPFIPFLTVAYLGGMLVEFTEKYTEKICERKYSGRDVLPYSFLLNFIFSAHHDHFLLS